MPAPFTTSRTVEFRDTDAAGIMHFSVFFTMMEQAEHELLRHLGLSVLTCDDEGPISWPRVSAHCEYRSAVKFEDVVDVEVRVARLGEKSVTYEFAFTCEGREVAQGTITAVCCRVDHGNPPRSISIPDWIVEKLKSVAP